MESQKLKISQLFDEMMVDLPPPNPDLPPRRAVSSYLRRLDRYWRGGWSWQWPLVIAGPKDGGKTQFLYQLIASSLLSFNKPWLVFYSDFTGNFRPERIQSILGQRLRGGQHQWQLGRLDKLTMNRRISFLDVIKWNWRQPNLALWVIAGWHHVDSSLPFKTWLNLLAEFSRRKQAGVILTIQGSVEELLPLVPWSMIPFFLYLSPVRHGLHRLRVWQNGAQSKIYDRKLTLNGYFREVRQW